MPHRTSSLAMLLTSVALALTLVACDGSEPEAATTEPDGTYTTRGRVSSVGDGVLVLHHEAIPEFRDREGEATGMASMAMRFVVADGVALEGIEAGDPVEATFEVRWHGEHTLTVSELRELPADTPLELGEPH